ncbi:LysR family transcriptional regulator [Mesorhizobium sp. CA7]|uniref:LysR family transcriptional regulator n=2 Tax=Mesorhizobium TaxID=68287 RepID=UPI001CCF1E3E|nr:LysR family transcriptional regulator [Mesorhizobium sp. CA7]MBZ9813584.1 LysR family transcriptional regulator [Mesorhizobium sp. CA7]
MEANPSYELKDIRCFVQIARAGSISRAADTYSVPKSTLSHYSQTLEDALQVELFVRRRRGLELTDAGREYLDNCTAIFDSCDNAASAAQRAHSSISGSVRVIASSEFGTAIIGAAAHFLLRDNPNIDVDVKIIPNDKLIVGDFDFDCMIYVGEPPNSALMRRTLGAISYALYASPDFLARHGTPETIADIERLNGVVYMRNSVVERSRLRKDKAIAEAKPIGKFKVNDYWMTKYFTAIGSAISYLPDFFVEYEVAAGALVPVLPDWRSEKRSIYALYPAQRHRSPRVMKFVETVSREFDRIIRYPGYLLVKLQESSNDETHRGAPPPTDGNDIARLHTAPDPFPTGHGK